MAKYQAKLPTTFQNSEYRSRLGAELLENLMATNRWTKEQLKLAFHLYCQLPFGKLDMRTPEVIKLASLIGRTPGAVAMKLSNFASLDPA